MSGTILQPVVGKRRGGSFTSGPPPHSGTPTILSVSSTFTTFADTARSGSITNQIWQNPSNAQSSDDTRSVMGFSGASAFPIVGYTTYLKATQLTTTIPSDATPVGIVISIERRKNPNDAGVSKDSQVFIVQGGTIQTGTNKADTSTGYTSSDVVATYGSSSDLWGLSWAASDINASGFGVVLSVDVNNTGGFSQVPEVDQISAVIYYIAGSTPTGRRGHHGNCMI